MAIEKHLPSHPLEVIRSGIVFVQNWAPLLKEVDQEISKATDKMKTYLYNFRPNEMPAPDISVI
jgi:hypothetical protein